jgi:hypothetical protein
MSGCGARRRFFPSSQASKGMLEIPNCGLVVTVIADAVSSRTEQNRQTALVRLAAEGTHVSSTEMALFGLLKSA